MGASAGKYAVNIGKGALTGAAVGSVLGPYGAGIGAGIGAIGGGISTLLSSSDEAKERERQKKLYLQQMQERADDDYEKRFAAITGISGDPMYIAMGHDPYDPQKASADFDAGMPDEPTPDYGGLAQSAGQLGSVVGSMSRVSDLAQRSEDARNLALQGASGNAWAPYAQADQSKELEELLERARRASPGYR